METISHAYPLLPTRSWSSPVIEGHNFSVGWWSSEGRTLKSVSPFASQITRRPSLSSLCCHRAISVVRHWYWTIEQMGEQWKFDQRTREERIEVKSCLCPSILSDVWSSSWKFLHSTNPLRRLWTSSDENLTGTSKLIDNFGNLTIPIGSTRDSTLPDECSHLWNDVREDRWNNGFTLEIPSRFS